MAIESNVTGVPSGTGATSRGDSSVHASSMSLVAVSSPRSVPHGSEGISALLHELLQPIRRLKEFPAGVEHRMLVLPAQKLTERVDVVIVRPVWELCMRLDEVFNPVGSSGKQHATGQNLRHGRVRARFLPVVRR